MPKVFYVYSANYRTLNIFFDSIEGQSFMVISNQPILLPIGERTLGTSKLRASILEVISPPISYLVVASVQKKEGGGAEPPNGFRENRMNIAVKSFSQSTNEGHGFMALSNQGMSKS